MHACHLREHGHPTIAPSLRTGAAIDGGAHTLSASTPVRAAPGGVAAPSPSAAAAGTVSRSPCARRSPGGATPAGGEAAALAEPKGLLGFESLRGQFIFVSGEWRQVRKVGPKQTSAAAVIFKLPNSAGKLPEEKWEVAPVLQVFDTAAILEALEYQKSDPSASWEHAVSEHARGVLGWMALNAASATPGSPCGGGPGGSGGGGGSAGGAEAEAGGGGVAGGGGLSASRPLGGGGAAGSGSAGAAQPDPPPPHPRGQTLAPSMPQSSLPPYTLITLYPRDTPTPTLEQVVALAPTRWCRRNPHVTRRWGQTSAAPVGLEALATEAEAERFRPGTACLGSEAAERSCPAAAWAVVPAAAVAAVPWAAAAATAEPAAATAAVPWAAAAATAEAAVAVAVASLW